MTEEAKGYLTIHSLLNLLLYFAAPTYLASLTTGESESNSKMESAIMCGESPRYQSVVGMSACAIVIKPTDRCNTGSAWEFPLLESVWIEYKGNKE